MTDHEYSILDHDRGQIFQYIGTAITVLAALYAASLGLIGHLVARVFPGVWEAVPKTLDSAVAFSVLYFIFNRWLWRNWLCRLLLGFHDISGSWKVDGVTMGPAEALDAGGVARSWNGTIKISQQWTKIGVRLQTLKSESFSKSAALQDIYGEPFLMYSYSNKPDGRAHVEEGLTKHDGYCELRFDKSRKVAKGWYFNNMGRVTYGEMTLTKIEN